MFAVVFFLAVSGVALATPRFKHPIPTDGRIIGGKDADIADFPWQISVQYLQQHYCGGFLISNSWVVTTAHCIADISDYYISIRAGSSSSISGGQIIYVNNYILHPDFYYWQYDYDIALLQLESPVTIANAKAITLISAGEAIPADSIVTVSGWGNTNVNETQLSEILQQISVPTLSQTDCDNAYPYTITDGMFCAGFYETGGKDPCKGDAGSPAVLNGKAVGISSWGSGCGEPHHPGVYVNISTFRDWIERETGI